jgi:Domain of unknown function (DUF4432)
MPSFIMTDVSGDVYLESFHVDATALGLAEAVAWSVRKERLRGGRRDGVDLVVVDNGALRFSIVPTRGMGLWNGWFRGNRLGWDSPISDGPVHPHLVNLSAAGGLGWLDGFDELLARCGLENNGAPFEVKTHKPDGSDSNVIFGLHGRIANLPASYVAVHVDAHPPHEIVVEGHVDEARLFGMGIRMLTRISTRPGENSLVVRDEFINLKEQPVEMQILYHWNFGPPFLEEGARFVAPVKTVTPRDRRAEEGIGTHNHYSGPEPGFAEQVFFYELHPNAEGDTRTLVLLENRAKDKAVVLRFDLAQLPAFTLWKNTGGLRDGYVTGLEPGSNYPNPRPFEHARKRVLALPAGGRHVAETRLEVLEGAAEVAAVEAQIAGPQGRGTPTVNSHPVEPFAPTT